MFAIRRIATAATFLLFALVPLTVFSQPVYTYQQIDFPGAHLPGTVAAGINDAGEVAGYYYDEYAYFHGFTLDHGVFTTVDFPDTAFQTSLEGINNNCGSMVGHIFYNNGFTVLQSFTLTNGKFTVLNYPGSVSTLADGIDNKGHISGTYQVGEQPTGFVFSNNSFKTPRNLPPFAVGLNDLGDEVGYYCPGNPTCNGTGSYTGFLYSQRTQRLSPIAFPGAPGEFQTQAAGISNSGEVVGSYFAHDANSEGFLYSQGIYTTIAMPGAIGTQANSINNAGVIAGTFWEASGAQHGFIATPYAHAAPPAPPASGCNP